MEEFVAIADSARRHGIAEADTFHAYRNPMWHFVAPDELDFVVGADQAGRLLEVGYVVSDDGVVVIVHAMPLRPGYGR